MDAAQKLSITVKSHSSSISAEDAKKIKNLINKKNSDKQILSINKSANKKSKYKENKSSVIPSANGKPLKDNSNKNLILTKPLSKPESLKVIPNQFTNPKKPNIVNNSKVFPLIFFISEVSSNR